MQDQAAVAVVLFNNRARIATGAIAGICIALALFSGSGWMVLFLAPAIIGAAAATIGLPTLNDWIARRDAAFERMIVWASPREGKFARYFAGPVSRGSLWVWNRTAALENQNIQTGLRLTIALYFWSVMIALLVLAVYVIVGLIVLALVIAAIGWVLSQSNGETSSHTTTYRPPRRSSSPSFFATKCASCGSKNHATSDCPHGLFSTKCSNCGSTDHASADCPHGFLSSACSNCGSRDHATADCPHGWLSSKCSNCGSTEHQSSDCPHGFLSSKCANCGSVDHATVDCPH